jgi:hypothetical protein
VGVIAEGGGGGVTGSGGIAECRCIVSINYVEIANRGGTFTIYDVAAAKSTRTQAVGGVSKANCTGICTIGVVLISN